jgi:hypothetical protein
VCVTLPFYIIYLTPTFECVFPISISWFTFRAKSGWESFSRQPITEPSRTVPNFRFFWYFGSVSVLIFSQFGVRRGIGFQELINRRTDSTEVLPPSAVCSPHHSPLQTAAHRNTFSSRFSPLWQLDPLTITQHPRVARSHPIPDSLPSSSSSHPSSRCGGATAASSAQ